MKDSLTIRLEGDRGLASSDGGETRELTPRAIEKLWEISTDPGASVSGDQPSLITAGLLAGLAEAEGVRPLEGVDPQVDAGTPAAADGLKLGPLALSESNSLVEVLVSRRSERAFTPPDLAELATVLIRAGRVRGWSETPDGGQKETRALPSAGACQPIGLNVLTTGITGLDTGQWQFDPLRCELHHLVSDLGQLDAVQSDLRARGFDLQDGFTAVFAIADFSRTLARYPAGGSLVWRDAGVVLAGLHLCASDIGLASCIVGSSGQLGLAPERGRTDVGALLLGHPLP